MWWSCWWNLFFSFNIVIFFNVVIQLVKFDAIDLFLVHSWRRLGGSGVTTGWDNVTDSARHRPVSGVRSWKSPLVASSLTQRGDGDHGSPSPGDHRHSNCQSSCQWHHHFSFYNCVYLNTFLKYKTQRNVRNRGEKIFTFHVSKGKAAKQPIQDLSSPVPWRANLRVERPTLQTPLDVN